MPQRPTPAALRAVVDRLASPAAGDVLREALAASGEQLRDWSVRSVHRRGESSIAVVFRVDVVDARGDHRDRLQVVHAARGTVPPGATRTELDGTLLHVWAFPNDPYLPGLPTAVNVAAARTLLGRVAGGSGARPVIRTRSYRPTRRAVVELRPSADTPPAIYVKLLGGRRPEQVRDRAARLVAVHGALQDADLPVPPVLEHNPDLGRVVLGAVTGRTLRELLRTGRRPPPVADLLDLVDRLQRVAELPGGGDPDAFADVSRHVTLLAQRLPHRRRDLETLATAAAAVGGPVGTVHGDLHDGQVVVADGRVTGLLDVDGAGTGRVAHDLGRLLAGVDASLLASEGSATQVVADHLDALTSGAAARCPAPDVARATAGAWVGLATGPLRVASPQWRTEVEQRLDRALAWARRAA